MKVHSRLPPILLAGLLLALAAFVWQSGSTMPEVVASQFGSSGAAHRFMARDTYVALMLVLVVGVPLLMAFLPAAIAGHDGARLNIPNRHYWLAPERREATRAFIRSHGHGAATVSALFLAYVHWLVVDANRLVHGAPEAGAFVLNPGDAGLLASLDQLSAQAASQTGSSGASIAAHVEHLRYGLSLMNRWAAGENPFADARWADSWKQSRVSDEEWQALRRDLRATADGWHRALQSPREVSGAELDGVIGSIVHLAYHLSAIRQINPAARGPRAND